jgi:hypothetical protein
MPLLRDLHAFSKALTFAPQASAGCLLGGDHRTTKTNMYSTNTITPDSAPCTTLTQIEGLSPRYSHIPTTQIVQTIREAGWEFASGTARAGRTPERIAHAAHVLRFRNNSLPKVNDNIIEAVILNSHDGTTAFEMGFGVYRLACANGLIIRTASLSGFRLTHSSLNLDNVFHAARSMSARAPQVAEIISRWQEIKLDEEQQLSLIRKSLTARWDNIAFADMDAVIRPQRAEDTGSDLWTSFNRIQERVIRGGMEVTLVRPITNEDGTEGRALSRRKATAIRGAIKQVRLNQELFEIAESFAA